MPRFTWENVKNNQAEREALFQIVEAIGAGVAPKPEELRGADDDTKRVRRARPERVRNLLGRMRSLSSSTKEKNPDFEDCMANLASMLKAFEEDQPEKYQALAGLPGFQDVRESAEALLPEPDTAGAAALALQDGIYNFGGPDEVLTDMGNGLQTAYNYLALIELTEGAEDWRSVPVKPDDFLEEGLQVAELFQNYGSEVTIDFDGEDGALRTLLSAPGRNAEAERMAYQTFSGSVREKRDAQNTRQLKQYIDSGKPNDKKNIPDAVSDILTNRMLCELLTGESSVAAAKDAAKQCFASGQKYVPQFMASLPDGKLRELAGKDNTGKALEGAFRKYVVALDKIPDDLDAYLRPTAKERIEGLQEKLKTTRDAEQKRVLAAEIIATREAVGAKRGGEGLERKALFDVSERADELAAEMAEVYANDPRAMEKLLAKATSGHGGEMLELYREDYRKHVCTLDKLPAGLDESRLPTAKERIEGLQAAIENNPHTTREEASRRLAEIIAARETVGAKRGGDGLKNRLTNSNQINTRADALAKQLALLPEKNLKGLLAFATEGHGGEMEKTFKSAELQNYIRQAEQKQARERQYAQSPALKVMDDVRKELNSNDYHSDPYWRDKQYARLLHANAAMIQHPNDPAAQRAELTEARLAQAEQEIVNSPQYLRFNQLKRDLALDMEVRRGNIDRLINAFGEAADELARQNAPKNDQPQAGQNEPEREREPALGGNVLQ